jgi:hypothetical protein
LPFALWVIARGSQTGLTLLNIIPSLPELDPFPFGNAVVSNGPFHKALAPTPFLYLRKKLLGMYSKLNTPNILNLFLTN